MIQEYKGLHVIDVLTSEDVREWLVNDRTPENRMMIERLIQMVNKKAGEPLAMWDDVVFLHAIEMEWFLDDLLKRK